MFILYLVAHGADEIVIHYLLIREPFVATLSSHLRIYFDEAFVDIDKAVMSNWQQFHIAAENGLVPAAYTRKKLSTSFWVFRKDFCNISPFNSDLSVLKVMTPGFG